MKSTVAIGTLLALLTAAGSAQEPDQIRVQNHAGEWGALVPKESPPTALGFRSLRSNAATKQVGMVPNGVNNQAIVFRRRNPPKILVDVWTNGFDNPQVDLDAEIAAPITFWLVNGDPAEQELRMVLSFFNANYIWRDERTGLRLAWWNFHDKTNLPEGMGKVASINFETCDERGKLEAFGYDPRRLNVYIVDKVYGSRTRGTICGSPRNFVVLGVRAGLTLLAHELTHLLSLSHPSATSIHFDGTNLMSPWSSSRYYLTEGQVFRAHVDEYSVLNDVLDARPTLLQRDCFGNPSCPVRHKRVWPDGLWPAN